MALNPVEWAATRVPGEWLLAHLRLVLVALLALVLLAWAYESYREAEDRAEALEGFGERAKRGTGGPLNVALIVLVSIVGVLAQTSGALADLVGWAAQLVPQGPVITAGAFGIGLGTLSIGPWVELRPAYYLAIAGTVLVIAAAWRVDL